MDHSPGQGQFKTLESYLQYMMGNHAMSREQAEDAAHAKTRSKDGAVARVEALLSHAQRLGIPTASHDDDSIHRIATMRNLGVAMSEFPITLDTARAAVSCGLPTIRGAPNVLRGQSQSGSMRAIDAIRAGVASCLCSDYQPSTLIAAAFAAAADPTDLASGGRAGYPEPGAGLRAVGPRPDRAGAARRPGGRGPGGRAAADQPPGRQGGWYFDTIRPCSRARPAGPSRRPGGLESRQGETY